MKKDPGLIFRLCLMLGDVIAIIASFAFAYFTRTHIDQRPYFFEANISDFIITVMILIPIWIIILASLGLYQKAIFLKRQRFMETWRLFLASIIGIMTIITFDYLAQIDLFPVRVVALFAMLYCFVALWLMRALLRFIRSRIVKNDYGILSALIIGDHVNTEHLSNYISATPESGYRVVGIVSSSKYIPEDLESIRFKSLKDALKNTNPDVIFQTDEDQTEYVYRESLEKHLLYYFVPSETTLSSHIGQLELIGNTPAMRVNATPLSGNARIIKRTFDLILGGIATIVALIPMIVIWLIIKVSDLKHPAVYADIRLSRFNKRFKCYKFRSMKPEFNGLSPEEAFNKIGKPELIDEYRKNGDCLKNDPRITRIGRFIRRTSLDELPQLFNVLKGDISLVGPRALVPGELRDYGDRSLLLTVKSGLTGLAQVSGRRDIPFDERRALDIYYIQNWSLTLDLSILLRTIGAVFSRKGAK